MAIKVHYFTKDRFKPEIERYLCNHFHTVIPEYLTHDWEKVTCGNCLGLWKATVTKKKTKHLSN
jgi:hypothetical protein